MAKTIEQLKAQGAEIKNATVVGENTATRVGTLFTDIVDFLEEEKTAIIETDRIADGAITLEKIANTAIDNKPTFNSTNLVTSGGVADYLELAEEQQVNIYKQYSVISTNGNISQNGNGGNVKSCLVNEGSRYKCSGRIICNTGSSLKYAWYSDTQTFNSSTFISGGDVISSYDNTEELIIKAPKNAKALLLPVFGTYKIYELKGITTIAEQLENTYISSNEDSTSFDLSVKGKQIHLYAEDIIKSDITSKVSQVQLYAYINNAGKIKQDGGASNVYVVPVKENFIYSLNAVFSRKTPEDRLIIAFYSDYQGTYYLQERFFISGVSYISGISEYEAKVPKGAKFMCVEYTSTAHIKETTSDYVNLKNTVSELSSKGITIKNVTNGDLVHIADTSNIVNSTLIEERNTDEDYIIYNMTDADYAWIYTSVFNTSNPKVHIHLKVEFLSGTPKGIDVILGKSKSSADTYITLLNITEDGSYDILFDATYYKIYQNYDQFCVWINNRGQIIRVKISEFKIYEFENSSNFSYIEGDNVQELFETADQSLAEAFDEQGDEEYKVAPNGKKYYLTVSNDGSLVARSVIPAKGKFFGNSLLAGNERTDGTKFGMAASDISNDYYALMEGVIKTLNPSYTQARIGAAGFEAITQSASMQNAYQTYFGQHLSGDEDFIAIQLGDNVAAQNVTWWLDYAKYALSSIKNTCQNARIIWFGVWYGSKAKITGLKKICKDTGCLFVNISDFYKQENFGGLGNLIKLGEADRTLEGVVSVTENSASNITVTFTYNGMTGSATLDVINYSISGSTLTYRSLDKIITYEYSHPSDKGFKLISNRLAYKMGLTDSLTYYT